MSSTQHFNTAGSFSPLPVLIGLKRKHSLYCLDQGGPTSALLWATFQNYSSLRASVGQKFLFSFQNQVFSKKKKKKKVFTWNRSPKFLFWRKIIAFSKKKLRLLLLIDKTCAKLICGMRPASP